MPIVLVHRQNIIFFIEHYLDEKTGRLCVACIRSQDKIL